MAFDHHVEADQVDLTLGGIMARAPIIGSLMYLLGGHHAKAEQENESNARKEMIDFAMAEDNQPLSLSGNNGPIKSALKKSCLSLASTDYSEGDDSFRSALEIDSESESDFSSLRKKKELSWSDHSGQDLVEYIEACMSSSGNPSLALNSMVSRDGGMSRSRSIRKQLEENQMHALRTSNEKSYLPKMNNQGHGVAMPTMHGLPQQHHTNNNGGIESPQWGWYTNLTPPSPEMYSSNPLHKKQPSSSSTASTLSDASMPKRASTKPNHIFQNLPSQKRDRTNCPALPL